MSGTTKTTANSAKQSVAQQQQLATAKLFLLNMQTNVSMRQQWQSLVHKMQQDIENSSMTNDAKEKIQIEKLNKLNQFIISKGYQTSANAVMALINDKWLNQYSQNSKLTPKSKETDKASQLVEELMNNAKTFTNWQAALSKSLKQDRGAANTFLKSWNITVDQARTAFIAIRNKKLSHWSGIYGNSVIKLADGTEHTGPAIIVYGDEHVSIGNTILLKQLNEKNKLNAVSYDNGVLTWDKTADPILGGADYSGKLTFSHISRPVLGDDYTGFEIFGTITYPQEGSPPKQGTVNIAARIGKPPDKQAHHPSHTTEAVKIGHTHGGQFVPTPPTLQLETIHHAHQRIKYVDNGMSMVEFLAAAPEDVK